MKYLILIVCTMLLSATICSQTIVSGNVTGTWTPSGNPYIVSGHINVVTSLKIEPGVIVRFNGGGWSLKAGPGAKLNARGSLNNPILFEAFTIQNPGAWDAIILENTGSDDTLEYCTIQSAKDGVRILSTEFQTTNSTILNSVFYNCSDNGVIIKTIRGQALATLRNCHIHNNIQNGVYVWASYLYCESTTAKASILGCTIDQNAQNGILIQGDGAICGNSPVFLSQAELWNSTITRNGYDGIYATDSYLGGKCKLTLENCIIAYNRRHGVVNVTQDNVSINDVAYNCFWRNPQGNFQNITGTGFGQNGGYTNSNGDSCDIHFNIYYDPLFVDTSNNDYRIQLCSKLIDAGTPVINGQYVLDPDNTFPDIGAEFFDQLNPSMPLFFADSTSFSFGNVPVDSSVIHEFNIYNHGSLPLHISKFSAFPNSIITVSPQEAFIDSGGVEQFQVTFSPQTIGIVNGKILAYHNARCVPDTFIVTGNGIDLTYIETDEETFPRNFDLAQNYPNPFNPSTIIKYNIPKTSKVSLKVYDILGKEVCTLVDGYKDKGFYQIEFNSSNLASGIYIYQMQADDFIAVKKMINFK